MKVVTRKVLIDYSIMIVRGIHLLLQKMDCRSRFEEAMILDEFLGACYFNEL